MCEALRRVVICFGWSGVEETRQRECEEANAGIKDSAERRGELSVQDRIEEDKGQICGLLRCSGCRKRREIPRFACPRRQARNDGFGVS